MLIALGIYLYISVVSIWFALKLYGFPEMPDNAEFHRQTRLWLVLSWHRVVLQIIGTILLLIALSKPKLNESATQT